MKEKLSTDELISVIKQTLEKMEAGAYVESACVCELLQNALNMIEEQARCELELIRSMTKEHNRRLWLERHWEPMPDGKKCRNCRKEGTVECPVAYIAKRKNLTARPFPDWYCADYEEAEIDV